MCILYYAARLSEKHSKPIDFHWKIQIFKQCSIDIFIIFDVGPLSIFQYNMQATP